MVPLQKILSENIKFLRKEKKLSQAKVAELIGVSTTFIGELETGRKFLSAEILQKLSYCLEVEVWELFFSLESVSNSKDVYKNQKLYSDKFYAIMQSEIGLLCERLRSRLGIEYNQDD